MDLLLTNASLIDGTGAPARPADVAVTGDRITAIGEPGTLAPGDGTEVVDLAGLVLAPGFIDIHTHYDAQILWDGDLTPSSWHGVTSVVMGNCGFAIAPTKPEHREIIVRTLENVEGMSMEALEEGIDWCFETFPEYLDAIDGRAKRLNVAAFAGHSSAEPGHALALRALGLRPLLGLDLRLGEGTGALLALPLVVSAARALRDVATFDSAGVTEK